METTLQVWSMKGKELLKLESMQISKFSWSFDAAGGKFARMLPDGA